MDRKTSNLMEREPALSRLTPFYRRHPDLKSKKATEWVFAVNPTTARPDDLGLKRWIPASEANAAIAAPTAPTGESITETPNPGPIATVIPPQAPPNWTLPELEKLVELSIRFQYRWPVIADRWPFPEKRTIVELRAQLYSMCVFTVPFVFNATQESLRLTQLDSQFRQSKEDEVKAEDVLEQIRHIDQKLKHMDGSFGTSSALATSKLEQAAKAPDNSSVILRSSRVDPRPHPTLGLGTRLNEKVTEMLTLLEVPTQPMPTPRVCDAHDELRRDIVKWIAVKRHIKKLRKQMGERRIGDVPQQRMAGFLPATVSPVSQVVYDPASAPAAVGQDLKRRSSTFVADSRTKKMKH